MKLDSVVWKKLAAKVMANVLGQHYFSEFFRQQQPIKFDNLLWEYPLSRQGHRVVLEFLLLLVHPQSLNGQRYTFSTFDPTYFVDTYYDSEKSLIIPVELAQPCRFTLTTPKPNASLQMYALSLDKADAPVEVMDLGCQFAQTVVLMSVSLLDPMSCWWLMWPLIAALMGMLLWLSAQPEMSAGMQPMPLS